MVIGNKWRGLPVSAGSSPCSDEERSFPLVLVRMLAIGLRMCLLSQSCREALSCRPPGAIDAFKSTVQSSVRRRRGSCWSWWQWWPSSSTPLPCPGGLSETARQFRCWPPCGWLRRGRKWPWWLPPSPPLRTNLLPKILTILSYQTESGLVVSSYPTIL